MQTPQTVSSPADKQLQAPGLPGTLPAEATLGRCAGQPCLQELLVAMSRYGRPRLSLMKDGFWYCQVDMNTNAPGASFEIGCDFNKHPTATAAAMECADRIRTAVKTIGSAA